MNNQYSIQKNIKNNIFIICLLIFAVIYIILNYNNLYDSEFIYNNIFKSLLITFLIILILYVTLDEEENMSINVKSNIVDNNIPIYKIMNDGGDVVSKTNKKLFNFSKISNDDNKSIFISQQNTKKFGLNL